MAHAPYPRLPVQPLRAYAVRCGASDSVESICDWLDILPRTYQRWATDGGIPINSADRIAISLGRHPAEIWGRAYWDLEVKA